MKGKARIVTTLPQRYVLKKNKGTGRTHRFQIFYFINSSRTTKSFSNPRQQSEARAVTPTDEIVQSNTIRWPLWLCNINTLTCICIRGVIMTHAGINPATRDDDPRRGHWQTPALKVITEINQSRLSRHSHAYKTKLPTKPHGRRRHPLWGYPHSNQPLETNESRVQGRSRRLAGNCWFQSREGDGRNDTELSRLKAIVQAVDFASLWKSSAAWNGLFLSVFIREFTSRVITEKALGRDSRTVSVTPSRYELKSC